MTWDKNTSCAYESRKCRWDIVPYTRGRGLDLGCGPEKTFAHFIGVDNGHHEIFQHKINPDVKCDAKDLSMFATESLNFCFSSHFLEHVDYEEVPKVLAEWMRVIIPGGHLILYLPDKALYPNVGEPHCNPDHKWDPDYDSVVAAMEKVECDWDLIDYQLRDKGDEYSGYYVWKKL